MMLRRAEILGGVALALLLGTLRAAAAPQTSDKPVDKPPAALCGDCHDAQAKTFFDNPHARARKKTEAATNIACESCHGEGATHIESSGQTPMPRPAKGLDGAATCLTCHQEGKERRSFQTGVHAATEAVNCLSCHSIHSAHARSSSLLAKEQTALCGTCHPTQTASFRNKPFAHRIGRGGMECSSCHDPHGRAGRESLKLTRGDEPPCLSCHSEKRGPFVFEHVSGVAGDCMTCHEAHGSSNPKRLVRARVDQLCLECHSALSPALLGSQPPATHDLFVPRYRNCTTCHVAIHGSHRSPRLLK